MVSLNRLSDDLTNTEFEIGDTRFFVAKLPAMAAFDLLELIRHELGRSADLNLPETAEDRDILSILKIVLSLDPAFVRLVRTTLFERVSFADVRVHKPQKLAGAEDMAFGGLEPVAVYEVLLRCLAVNFTESLRTLVSRFGGATQGSIQSDPSE